MISDQDLFRSSIVRRVAAKVASAPTLKTASHAGYPPVGLLDAVQALGTKIASNHLRQARVASAIDSLEKLAVTEGWVAQTLRAPRQTLSAAMEAGSATHHLRPKAPQDLIDLAIRMGDTSARLQNSTHPLANYAQGVASTEASRLGSMYRDMIR